MPANIAADHCLILIALANIEAVFPALGTVEFDTHAMSITRSAGLPRMKSGEGQEACLAARMARTAPETLSSDLLLAVL
jgi:hypothetical protein